MQIKEDIAYVKDTYHILTGITNFISLCNNESSIIGKKLILKNRPEKKILLKMVYDPTFDLNITGKKIKKEISKRNSKNPRCIQENISSYLGKTIYDLLLELHNRIVTGKTAIDDCIKVIYDQPLYKDTIFKILDKNLDIGIGIKEINEVFPNLIIDFNKAIPLAKEYKSILCDFEHQKWYSSRKLNGIRCLCFIEKGRVKFYSRNGIEFNTLNRLRNGVKMFIKKNKSKINLDIESMIIDGEVCIINEYIEDFNEINSKIRKKNYTILNPGLNFCIFDMYNIDEFRSRQQNKPQNMSILDSSFNIINIEQTHIKNKEHLINIISRMPDYWEGTILKRSKTLFKRSNHLLKIKKFQEIDLKVIDIVSGSKIIDDKSIFCVYALMVEYKGNRIDIIDGISDANRLDWYFDPKSIIGKIITIKYFLSSTNNFGLAVLKLPILKCIK